MYILHAVTAESHTLTHLVLVSHQVLAGRRWSRAFRAVIINDKNK